MFQVTHQSLIEGLETRDEVVEGMLLPCWFQHSPLVICMMASSLPQKKLDTDIYRNNYLGICRSSQNETVNGRGESHLETETTPSNLSVKITQFKK